MAKNSLSNETTIKRLVSKISPNAKQKKAVKTWLVYLENNKLENEKQAYIEFANVILRDLLGYDISLEGLKHEESNIEFLFKKDGNNLICFEVKGTKTGDLWAYQGRDKKSRETPVNQINSYMYEQKIPFGILTNYKQFVLFDRNEGSKKFHIIDFTELNKEDKLKEFIALFSREKVEEGFIEDVIEKSIVEEREFTKEFYKLYHETRLMLIKEFEENSEIGREASVHFAQLYLNRLMFVFFAEDTGKLDRRIIEERILQTLESVHLFSSNTSNISGVIVNLFNDLDKGSDFPKKIFGFNGGLFRHPIPPKIHFMDLRNEKFFIDFKQNSKLKNKDLDLNEKEKEIFEKFKNKINPIIKNILLMASFDFNTEVNVNILGHIFEQSISDIEDLKTDSSSRRKKEGIFYTPEYITDYICRNTIIPHLSEKGVTSVPDLIKEYVNDINKLESKFKKMKILDPACGSGAFLIKATDVMLEIFKAIQEFKESEGKYEAFKFGNARIGKKKLKNTKGQLNLFKWDEEGEAKEIIENNIYGVDINEESVEITKLSLFLKMTRKNRKLTDLSKNIKQGNSLIDDEEVAGKLAFNWNEEFKDVLDNGGFDVIVGNPPYVDSESMTKYNKKERDYLSKKYETTKGNWDLYIPFIEKAYNLLSEKGRTSMITPNKWLSISYGNAIRNFIGKYLYQLSDYSDIKVFEDAGIFPIVFFVSKKENPLLNIKVFSDANKFIESKIKKKVFEGFDNFGIFFSKHINIIMKLLESNKPLGTISNISGAFTTSEAYDLIPLLEDKEINSEDYLKFVNTGTIDSYFPLWGFQDTRYIKKEYSHPVISKQIFKKKFMKRYERFNKPKIIIAGIRHFECFYDEKNEYLAGKSTSVLVNLDEEINYESLNSILNSKLITFYLKEGFSSAGMDGGINFSPAVISTIPIPKIENKIQKELANKSNKISKSYEEFYEKKDKFLTMLKSDTGLEKVSKKLDKFYSLEWSDFDKEIKKQKINLSSSQEEKWFDRFDKYKKELSKLKEEIDKTDREIDEEVYKLYGLKKEDIRVIEEGLVGE